LSGEKTKKPLWKRWWLWVIVVFIVIGFAASNGDEEEEVAEEEVAEEEVAEEEVEPTLTSEEVDEIAEHLEEVLEREGEDLEKRGYSMNVLELYEIEFDADANQLNFTVDYQTEEGHHGPLLPADELKDLNESWAWTVAEAMPGISEQDFDIRVMAFTTFEDDEGVLHWVTTTYRDGEYSFREGQHFDELE